MLVPRDRMQEAASIAAEVAGRIRVGDPRAEGVEIGPLVSGQQWQKVQDLIQKGIDEGAMLVAGGTGRPEGLDKGFFAKPTVFAGVTNESTEPTSPGCWQLERSSCCGHTV